MSFILDALKKSESDRHRQSGPALFEVKVARPRSGLPLWAIAIAALLAINVAIAAWILWHPARSAAAAATTAPAAASVSAPSGAAPGVGSALPPASLPQTAVAAPTAAPASAKLAPAAAPAGAAANAADASAVDEDNAPASEPAASGLSTSHVRRTTAAGVPLYQDAAATPGSAIPPLRLDLHAYADRPQDRWVMINMHKLREGDSLPNGVHVDSITRDGAVLSYNGSRFLLARE